MIRFALHCESGHGFEAWFARNADFDEQAARGLVTCPSCGTSKVAKALMAPAVSTARKQEETIERTSLAMNAAQAEQIEKVKQLVAAIRANSEDVGERFPEEARKIHYGETDPRGIIGKAAPEEARELAEEGIAFGPLPHFPDETN
jgi:hypothetical protein